MRLIDTHERTVLFEDGDEMPPEMMITWNHQAARKRMQPQSLTMKWETTRDTGEWELRDVYIYGRHVHATASNSFIHYLYQRGAPMWMPADPKIADDTPEWVAYHVALSHPLFMPTVLTETLDSIKAILGLSS